MTSRQIVVLALLAVGVLLGVNVKQDALCLKEELTLPN